MADIMIATVDGSTPFDAERLAEVARQAWPQATWPSSPDRATGELARLKIEAQGKIVFVDVLPPGGGLGVEGDDELTAEFVAWITTQVSITDGQLVITDWANEVVSLRQQMSVSDVLRLREHDAQA